MVLRARGCKDVGDVKKQDRNGVEITKAVHLESGNFLTMREIGT